MYRFRALWMLLFATAACPVRSPARVPTGSSQSRPRPPPAPRVLPSGGCFDARVVARGLLPAYVTRLPAPDGETTAGPTALLLDQAVLQAERWQALVSSHQHGHRQQLSPAELEQYLGRPLPVRVSVLGIQGRANLTARPGLSWLVWGGSGATYLRVVTELRIAGAALARPWHPADDVFATPADFVPAVLDHPCAAELRWAPAADGAWEAGAAGLPSRDLQRAFPSLYERLGREPCVEPQCEVRVSRSVTLLPDRSRVFTITVAYVTPDPKNSDECNWEEANAHGIFWQRGPGRRPQLLGLSGTAEDATDGLVEIFHGAVLMRGRLLVLVTGNSGNDLQIWSCQGGTMRKLRSWTWRAVHDEDHIKHDLRDLGNCSP